MTRNEYARSRGLGACFAMLVSLPVAILLWGLIAYAIWVVAAVVLAP